MLYELLFLKFMFLCLHATAQAWPSRSNSVSAFESEFNKFTFMYRRFEVVKKYTSAYIQALAISLKKTEIESSHWDI